jgi:trehalose synthase
MIEVVPVDISFTLDDYAGISHLAGPVHDLRSEASMLIPQIQGRTVWMVNSTARGGGVAEMMPMMVKLLCEMGLPAKWVVIGTDRPEFFRQTKLLHNLLHGHGDARRIDDDREVYERVNRECADELKSRLRPDDLLVIHDPQPLAMGAFLKRELGIRAIWRCHIGHDENTPETQAAWRFLQPYAEVYDQTIFSCPEYIPAYLAGRATVIHPGLDPESHKNRDLPPHKLMGILVNSGLKNERQPVVTPAFRERPRRLKPDGTFIVAEQQDEIGLLYRPIITQISRWDRLKGFQPLLSGFVTLKERLKRDGKEFAGRHRRCLEIARLVLAGPDPASVQDDPEGREVLDELCAAYREMPAEYQSDVALLTLPMGSRKQNALMVNALQRCSTIIVQNSLREGFGLTATEAMWKRVPIIGSRACGLRVQIRQGIDGALVRQPDDREEVADVLDAQLRNVAAREIMARKAQRRVHDEFLIFTQLQQWVRLLSACAHARPRPV